jgi:hypothetical protein
MPFSKSRQFQAVALGCALFFSHNGVLAAEGLGSAQCPWALAGPLEKGADSSSCGRPVDDKFVARRTWSYPPACAHPESGEGIPYCVYSYKDIRGGAGLSLLATPEIAADLEGHLDDLNPTWLHPQAQEYYRHPQIENPAFEVRDLPGKGKGAVATRLIRAGEVVIRESPAIINVPELPKGVLPAQVGPMFEVALQQLPEAQQKRVIGLSRGKSSDDLSHSETVNQVLNTNSFGIQVKDHFLAALCPDIAVRPSLGLSLVLHADRHPANESRMPPQVSHIHATYYRDSLPTDDSMFTRFSYETFTMEAVAYADIQPGEELHLSCNHPDHPDAQRSC